MTISRSNLARRPANTSRQLLRAAGAALGLALICVDAPPSIAQPMTYSPSSYMQPAGYGGRRMMNRPGMNAEADDEADEDEVDDGGASMTDREDRRTPKTDLGRAIMQQNIARDARSVLAARAKLAGEARERLLHPDKADPSQPDADKPDPAGAARAPEQPAHDDANIADDAALQSVPPELAAQMRQLLAARAAARAAAGTAGDPALSPEDAAELGDDGEMGAEGGDGEAAAPGANGLPGGAAAGAAGGPANTPDQVKKRREQIEKARKQAEHFRLLVVAGDWSSVHEFLKTDAGEDAELVYEWVIATLQHADQALVPDEVISISEASPVELNDKLINKLGALLKATQQRGCQAGAVAARIAQGTLHFGGTDPAKRKRAAGLLVAAGLPVQAQTYLPPLEKARESRDAELLNLYAIYFAALAKERTGAEREAAIDQGWKVSLEALSIENATSRERSKAIQRALGFIADIPAETADAWLLAMFAKESDAGWETIERVNRKSLMLRMRGGAGGQPDKRMQNLLLIQRLGRAILAASPETVVGWRTGLNMLTMTILEEAEMTRNMAAMNASNLYDEYGGGRGYGGGYGGGREQMQPIPAETLGKALPDAKWLGAIDAGLAAKLELMAASTAGGAGDTQAVLDMIRPIVRTDAERARKLAEALLKAWPAFVGGHAGDDDDSYGGYSPYGGYRRYGRYGYGGGGYGGYGGGGGGIPLTRAKQQRNLDKLRVLMQDLNALAIPDLPTDAIVDAFAASYSMAEVYTPEHIELVFGPLQSIPSATRFKIAAKMRQQLAGAWRSPQVQEQAGTKRNNAELAAEVARGYELAQALAGAGEETWERLTLEGDLFYDQAEFAFGQNADMSTYNSLRAEAFDRYAQASERYKAELASGKAKPSARLYMQWFSAALGASDLGFLTRQDRPDLQQVDDVRLALESISTAQGLTPDAGRKHIGLFAQQVLASMQRMSPELKPRFLREAMRIIADHPDGKPARDKLAYYDDLDKEVSLAVAVDASAPVSAHQLLGVNLAIRSTRAITRESGGFTKYLMSEQYNPMTGQPVNYKDEIEKQVREKWGGGGGSAGAGASGGGGFNIVSVTFHKPMVQPMGIGTEGWEETPIAYILMKPNDAGVDRIPALKLDMDFADGGGMVILPVTSAPVPLNTRPPDSADAPSSAPPALRDVGIEQVFDDREAPTGVVRLETRATAKGLLPAIDALLAADYGRDLKVKSIEDHGVNVIDLDTTTGEVVPVTERTWTITLEPSHADAPARSFTFPTLLASVAKLPFSAPIDTTGAPTANPTAAPDTKSAKPPTTLTTKLTNKRYADADVVEAKPTLAITGGGIDAPPLLGIATWIWWTGGAVIALAAGAGLIAWRRRVVRTHTPAAPRWVIPEVVTPMAAIALLRKMASPPFNGTVFNAQEQRDLDADIERLEHAYFAPSPPTSTTTPTHSPAELKALVGRWVARIER